MKRRIGWALSLLVLLVTGGFGVSNSVQEMSGAVTPLQRAVTIGEILYGVLGLAAGAFLVVRHRWSVPLALAWAVALTFVGSTAALAYAGPAITVGAAVSGGVGTAIVAAAVVWGARAAVRSRAGAREVAAVVLLLLCGSTLDGCRTLYGGPPVVAPRENDRPETKRVRAKREPDQLIAEDLSVCWVAPAICRGIKAGDALRCAWRRVPSGR